MFNTPTCWVWISLAVWLSQREQQEIKETHAAMFINRNSIITREQKKKNRAALSLVVLFTAHPQLSSTIECFTGSADLAIWLSSNASLLIPAL